MQGTENSMAQNNRRIAHKDSIDQGADKGAKAGQINRKQVAEEPKPKENGLDSRTNPTNGPFVWVGWTHHNREV